MKMKMIVKKQIITVIALLISTIALGQVVPLSGSGTVENPYIIKNYVEWNSFAESVNGENGFTAYNYEGKYIKLAEDIGSPTELCNIKMVGWFEFAGTWVGHAFAGNFDGNGKTLYVNIQDVEDNIYYAGPFGWVDGAKISNLTVAGQITTTIKGVHAAGIVSCVENNSLRPTYIIGCKSKVTIVSRTESNRGHHGGLVGWLYEGDLFFENCIFEGSMTGYTANCAGFVGEIRDDKLANVSVSYKNCTQAFNSIENDPSSFNTYHYPVSDDFPSTFENAYYTYRLASDNQGDRLAEAGAPSNRISRKYTSHGRTYYVPSAEIEGLRDYIKVYGGLKPYITYYGQELTQVTDYRISISGNTVTITGQNDYAGTFTATNVEIRDNVINNWTIMKEKMAEGTVSFVLQYDIVGPGDDALSVVSNKYAFVDLNGHTINRNMSQYTENGYVIVANRNATLTIVDRGMTKGKISGGKQLGDAGGVFNNWGTLKMYGVHVTGNMVIRKNANAAPWGVGAGVYGNGSMTIIGGSVSGNTADGGGGGIYAGGGDATNTLIKGVVIKNNVSGSKGGGIRVGERANKVTVEDCYITGNKLNGVNTQDGGGIYNEGSTGLTIKDCTITNNDAMHRGGAFFTLKDGVTHFENCLITNNTAVQDGGGGIYIHQGEVYIDGCTITGNISNKVGGVYVTTATGKDAKAGGVLYLQGKTTITDNLGDATKPNVYMELTDDLINISDKLHSESRIGVSRVNKGVLTKGLGGNGSIDNFISDNYQYYWLVKDGDEIALKETLRWSKPDEWGGSVDYSKEKKHLTVQAPFIIDKYVLNGVEQIPDVEDLDLSSPGKIFIEETDSSYGQLIYTGEKSVPVTVIKIIKKTNNNAGWYTISAPVDNPILSSETNLITSKEAPYNFDLLRYDEENCMWRSYNDPISYSTYYPNDKLLNGVGYIYRNYTKLAIEYNGNLVGGSVDVPITVSKYEAGISTVPGWNLIGNPYTHNIYKGKNTAIPNNSETSDYMLGTGFYTLSNEGAWKTRTDNSTVIKPGQGILVNATKAGTLTIINTTKKKSAKERNNDEYIEFTVANSNYEDVAYALFDDGDGLPKINHLNPDIPMIYIHQDDEDYAVATMGDETKAFNLNFKAMTTGQYTLSYKTEGEFNYLHVIDCFTGHDIDMLADEKYSFIASPRDKESRFIVRLQYKPNYSSDDNDIFAYQNGNDVLVSGEGELQVYDAMGRLVMSKRINGAEIVDLNTTGVYILKLIGEETHTQKLVVR